jgi:methyl-accepting chemotaxis protein
MAEFFEEMQRGYQKVLLDEHQKLSAGTAVAIGAVKEMLDDFERSMNDVEKRVPEGVQRAYSEAVTNILEASAKLSAAAIDSAKVAESLNRTTSDAQRGMAGLADVVRSLAGSVSRLDTSQVTSLDRKLDEILITVRDGTKIADLGGRPGDRRWWPWRSLTRRGED